MTSSALSSNILAIADSSARCESKLICLIAVTPGDVLLRSQTFQGPCSLMFSTRDNRLGLISSCGPAAIAPLSSIMRVAAFNMVWSSRMIAARPSPKIDDSSLSR